MNEKLIQKIREVLGYSDEGLDLFNSASETELTEDQQEEYIAALDVVSNLKINNVMLDAINNSKGNPSLLAKELEGVFNELDKQIDEATDPVHKKSLELYHNLLYRKLEKYLKSE